MLAWAARARRCVAPRQALRAESWQARPILSPATAELLPEIPLRRLGRPEEVAEVIYLLCTEQSSYINGPRSTSTAASAVDGG